MKASDYLDLAQRKCGVRNDNQLKDLLGWGDSKINNYRHNRQAMDNEAARQIAEILEVPVWQVIADMEVIRAKDPTKKKAWKMLAKLSKQSGRATANLLIPLLFSSFCVQILYIMLNRIDKNKALVRCEYLPLMV